MYQANWLFRAACQRARAFHKMLHAIIKPIVMGSSGIIFTTESMNNLLSVCYKNIMPQKNKLQVDGVLNFHRCFTIWAFFLISKHLYKHFAVGAAINHSYAYLFVAGIEDICPVTRRIH